MIDYISGKIAELTPTKVVIDNNGIGYAGEISLQTYQKLDGKTEAKVFIQSQTNPRDGSSVDYGFADNGERELFRLITSVSGMGASTARMMLSSMTSDELCDAIISEDINRIKSVKGLGLKTAQRLILELKDKVLTVGGSSSDELPLAGERNRNVEEAAAALQMLGFNRPAVEKVVRNILKVNPSAKVEEIIKEALKRL